MENRGPRVISEHGLISNILPGFGLVDQLYISHINSRTYKVTVTWNSPLVELPLYEDSNFPYIDDVSDDFVC